MKRVNVNYYFTIEFGDLFRPSMKDSIRDALYEQNVRTIKDVCQLEEKQFRRFPFATDDVVNRVKKRMADYGLRFGMTLDELTAYQDADFLLLHPEENTEEQNKEEKVSGKVIDLNKFINSFKKGMDNRSDETENIDEREEQMEQDKVAAVSILALMASFTEPTDKDSRSLQMSPELENRISTTLREVYFHQPWWKKLFRKPKARLKETIDETVYLCSTPNVLRQVVLDMQASLSKHIGQSQKKEK